MTLKRAKPIFTFVKIKASFNKYLNEQFLWVGVMLKQPNFTFMDIKYISPYWGHTHLAVDEFIKKAMDQGFDGVEMNVPFDPDFVERLQSSLQKYHAHFIAQQYLPPAIETADAYKQRMKEYLLYLAQLNPAFINSHSGKDFFSFDDNCSIIEMCSCISKETGINIIHETHRGRFTFHAYSLLPYLDKYNFLELTADFSHFSVVSESLFEDQEDVIKKIIPHCRYIHARVGFPEAPQLNHPFAPEWQSTLERYLDWWQQIVDLAKARGEKTFFICPEFGPVPYMPTIPFTEQPVSSQWDINFQMMNYLKKNLKN